MELLQAKLMLSFCGLLFHFTNISCLYKSKLKIKEMVFFKELRGEKYLEHIFFED